MARGTRDGETLRDLYRALGNEPYVVAETLARQTLVERLIHNWYGSDTRFHGELKARAEAELAACADASCMKSMNGVYRETTWTLRSDDAPVTANKGGSVLPLGSDEWVEHLQRLARKFGATSAPLPLGRLSGLDETREAFVVTTILAQREREITTASVTWPKRPFDAWWDVERSAVRARVDQSSSSFALPAPSLTECTNDTWTPTKLEIPERRYGHTAVWTGTDMIIWGGYIDATASNTGGRYNPLTDSWTFTSTGTNLPSARAGHTGVWTGTEMIVWGGYDGSPRNTGGRYNPSSDTWIATPMGASVPSARSGHTAVWTGTEMIVWGGENGGPRLNSGGRYNPSTNDWIATSIGANIPAGRSRHTAVWTGTLMVVWGGYDGLTPYANTGGRYNPSTDTWTATSTGTSVPSARSGHTAVWTGTEMIVWGGGVSAAIVANGGRYNPLTDSWKTTSLVNAPDHRRDHTAVWTGTEMIVWGGDNGSTSVNTGGRYSPSSESWMATPTGTNVPVGRGFHTAIWTGTELIVWGGADRFFSGSAFDSGGRFSPSTNNWIATSTGTTVPQPRFLHTAVWTGTEMIVWGGDDNTGGVDHFLDSGGRYTPSTDAWSATSTGTNAPDGRYNHTAVWTGTEMIVWGGFNGSSYLKTGGRYSPSTDTWVVSSTGTNVPAGRYSHSAAWTGTQMIVWGGYDGSNSVNTGGRYNPSNDTWIITSMGANVPAGRYGHTAVWTGTTMIAWGGYNGSSVVNTGGRYNASSDTWIATSTGPNAPAARGNHAAVWTGTEMIVWGGFAGSSGVNTGGRYNPSSNTWTATSIGANVPSACWGHSAVWTGSEMIVWGGSGSSGLNTGGRYNPSTSTWTATSAGPTVPAIRYLHSAVWTGTEMIVWGGTTGINKWNSGGAYCACPSGHIYYPDADGDGYGNPGLTFQSCDGSPPLGYVADSTDCNDTNAAVHLGAPETCNCVDDDCNGQIDEDASGLDSDGDSIRNACDNCVVAWNPSQPDFNNDGEGDVCDFNDGLIFVYSTDKNYREWQAESGYSAWNSYRGSLSALRATGLYTQAPGSNPLAARDCAVGDPYVLDLDVPAPGEVAFNLVTGVTGGIESGLGTNSAGVQRANANPCP